MMRIGLLGGTFDPPHLGHLVAAETARDVLGLDEVRWLVAGRPWMKEGETAAHHRVAMVEAALANHAAMSVDDREARRDGPTYTADTLAELTAEAPEVTWTFLLGADAAASLPAWHRIDEAMPLADWAVVARPGVDWPAHELADRLRRDAPDRCVLHGPAGTSSRRPIPAVPGPRSGPRPHRSPPAVPFR